MTLLLQVQVGKLRPLAIFTAKHSTLTPNIPAMKEADLAEMGPGSTPADIVQRMNLEINALLAMSDVREQLYAQYIASVGGLGQDLQAFMQQELRVMSPVIKRAGIKIK